MSIRINVTYVFMALLMGLSSHAAFGSEDKVRLALVRYFKIIQLEETQHINETLSESFLQAAGGKEAFTKNLSGTNHEKVKVHIPNYSITLLDEKHQNIHNLYLVQFKAEKKSSQQSYPDLIFVEQDGKVKLFNTLIREE